MFKIRDQWSGKESLRFLARTIGIMVLATCLTGCATMGGKMTNLSEGMDRAKVIQKLGKPDGFQRDGEYETLRYNHRLVSGWAYDRADYHVVLKNGKVVAYGQGDVRVKNNPNSAILYNVGSGN